MGTALSFELLDRHVISGRHDDVACSDVSGSLTFATLLERAAALAGGLRVLGIRSGEQVYLDLPAGNDRVIAACAVIRLGAVPDEAGAHITLVGDVPSIRINDGDVELALVERVGRADPEPAGRSDPPGYADVVTDAFGDIVGPLLTGSPVV